MCCSFTPEGSVVRVAELCDTLFFSLLRIEQQQKSDPLEETVTFIFITLNPYNIQILLQKSSVFQIPLLD
jgi:hypothetical protein